MLLSEKQRRGTLREIQNFKDALATIGSTEFEKEWHREIQISAIQSQVEVLEKEVAEYDMIKSGGITFAKTFSFDQLPDVLIKARIASGMTQTDLATQLNLKPQQIQRYESSEYRGTSLARLVEVARVLGVTVEGIYRNPRDQRSGLLTWSRPIDVVWEKLPIKEMVKRKWFRVTENDDEVQAAKQFVESACGGPTLSAALNGKKVSGDATFDEYSLLAWQARVLQQANLRTQSMDIPEFAVDERWLPKLKALTQETHGPKKAVKLLAENGIVLVIEKCFARNDLDGAAMLSSTDNPVIGLTLRHDRLDNFWFMLFHELGHVFRHLAFGHGYDFFDDEQATNDDKFECAAHEFAFDNLIAPNDWDECKSRFELSPDSVRADATRLSVGPSIVAGRIRRERDDGSLFPEFMGQGTVRVQFAS